MSDKAKTLWGAGISIGWVCLDRLWPDMPDELFVVGLLTGAVLFLWGTGHALVEWQRNRTPHQVHGEAAVLEFIPLPEAAQAAYDRLRNLSWMKVVHGLNQGAGVLRFMTQRLLESIPVWGIRPPATERDPIPSEQAKALDLSDDGLWLHRGDRTPLWERMVVRRGDLEQYIREQLGNPPRLALTLLRERGVVMRNEIPTFMADADLQAWIDSTRAWMNDVAAALGYLDAADSLWFLTLDTVPPARVPIPNIQLGGASQRAAFESNFRQHDYRLFRLDKLLQKHGVGANG
jgi:hypothetical protein